DLRAPPRAPREFSFFLRTLCDLRVNPSRSSREAYTRPRGPPMKTRFALFAALLACFAWARPPIVAQTPVFTTAFTPAEFAARRTKVMNTIGDAVAIISGATETSTYTKFRQGSQFFYLCGAEVPRAILLIDGRTKTSTLFLGAGGPSNEG